MAFKVVITEQALTDLGEILDYIGFDNADAAECFGNTLLNHSDVLETFPKLGILVDEIQNVRFLLHTPVRIYYPVDENRRVIEILHFWHTSRRPPQL